VVRLGINLMAWSGQIDVTLFPRIKQLGYDGVELPLLAPETVDAPRVKRALADAGLAATASGALPPKASLLDPARRDRAVNWIDNSLACAAACGATVLCGPFCAPVGQLVGRPPTPAEFESCVGGLRELSKRAVDRGVVLALEALNRFETYFMNTVDDAVRLLDRVDSPSIGVHLDTFHMNVEEKSPADALRRAGRHLAHVHFSENDRGVVGSGHVDWPGVRDALRDLGYLDGECWIVAETFAGGVPEIAAATAIWRQLVPDAWTYAEESLRFTKRLLEDG
jgi:D-psicose/D-tagatose/L-ribulose 3-epimerase